MEHFFNDSFNLEIWQSVGKMEYFMERLHILETGFARIFAPSFKHFPEILSIPGSIFISFNNLVQSSVTFENLNLEESKSKVS